MHESTVSRITTNKYVATPFGVYELKFFFNSALELDDGSQVGSESVKALIKKCISEEDPKNPLSDERIGEILKEHLKVNIARRNGSQVPDGNGYSVLVQEKGPFLAVRGRLRTLDRTPKRLL